MSFPLKDGKGPLPDSMLELVADIGLILFVGLAFSYFTGLDAQVSYALESPSSYFSVSDSIQGEEIVLDQTEIDLLNSASKNRIGTNVGDEIGFCGGIRSNGQVYDLRLAEGLETQRDSVRFSCSSPRNFIVHTQPYSGELSDEDKDFGGEFRPNVTCIVYEELAVSPLNSRVGGINCWSVPSSGTTGFEELVVVRG